MIELIIPNGSVTIHFTQPNETFVVPSDILRSILNKYLQELQNGITYKNQVSQ